MVGRNDPECMTKVMFLISVGKGSLNHMDIHRIFYRWLRGEELESSQNLFLNLFVTLNLHIN